MTIAVLIVLAIGVGIFIWGDHSAKNTKRLAEQMNDTGSPSHFKKLQQPQETTQANWTGFEKPDEEELKQKLSPMTYEVTQKEGTEPAFENEYFDHYKTHQGIYVDVISGEPLFSTQNQYASGTGWPSFTRPLEPSNIVTEMDYKMLYPRTQVLSRHAGSHLGHVFRDGPTTIEESGGAEPTGLRYCLNSAALEFIPAEELEKQGYGEYAGLFE